MESANKIKLCSVGDNVQAAMIIDILKQNEINAYKEGVGSAGVMDIYGGNSTFGEYIFVNEEDFEKAKELTRTILETESNSMDYRRTSKFSRVVGISILAIFAGVMIYIFYISM